MCAVTIGHPFTCARAGASRDLSSQISVSPDYYLLRGGAWADSGQSDLAKLPWGQQVTQQRVAVRWSLKTAATMTVSSGDCFMFFLPLAFSVETTAQALSSKGNPVGVARFAKNGAVTVVFDLSLLPVAQLPLKAGYIPFTARRPLVTSAGTNGAPLPLKSGLGLAPGAGRQGASSRSVSSGFLPDEEADSGGQRSDVATEAPATPGAGATSEEPTDTDLAPPAGPLTPTKPSRPAQGLDAGQVSTIALSAISAGIVALALVIRSARRRLPRGSG